MIDLTLTVLRGRFGASRRNLTGEIEMLLMTSVVLIGNARDKGRTAAEVGRVLGLPRVTTRRKLEKLVGRGMLKRVGKRYWIIDGKVKDFRYLDMAFCILRRAR